MERLKDRTILVVDDEIDIREVLLTRFELAGARPIGAETVEQAMSVLKSESVDVVLSDIRLKAQSGIDLVKRIREADPVAPAFIFISGHPIISVDEAYDLGADAMIMKPFRFEAIAQLVARSLTPPEELWTAKPAEAAPVRLSVKDAHVSLGRGGFFMATEAFSGGVGNRIDFQIHPQKLHVPPLHGTGVVKWIRDFQVDTLMPGIGVEFESLSEKTLSDVIKANRTLKTVPFIPKG